MLTTKFDEQQGRITRAFAHARDDRHARGRAQERENDGRAFSEEANYGVRACVCVCGFVRDQFKQHLASEMMFGDRGRAIQGGEERKLKLRKLDKNGKSCIQLLTASQPKMERNLTNNLRRMEKKKFFQTKRDFYLVERLGRKNVSTDAIGLGNDFSR